MYIMKKSKNVFIVAGQRGDGAYGAFIVRSPPQNYPNSHLYDFDLPHEHTMLLMDNSKYTSTEKFMHRYHDDGDINPTSLLINGRGVYANFSHGENEEVVHLPRSKFLVQEVYLPIIYVKIYFRCTFPKYVKLKLFCFRVKNIVLE